MKEQQFPIRPFATYLGYAGLIPQAAFLFAQWNDSAIRWSAQALGFGYAALLFSFLGGAWWGLALNDKQAQPWIYTAAIAPSLIALAAYFPWIAGLEWPGPSSIFLGLCLLMSPMVDKAIARAILLPEGWMKLRVHLSIGLGLLTIALGFLSLG
jgi:hypothetical protein